MLAVQTGLLDPLPLAAVTTFRTGLPAALDAQAAPVVQAMDRTGRLDDAARAALLTALQGFAATLTPADPVTDP